MSEKAQGTPTRRKGSFVTDLTAKRSSDIKGGLSVDAPHPGLIIYDGHAGLGANQVVGAGPSRSELTS